MERSLLSGAASQSCRLLTLSRQLRGRRVVRAHRRTFAVRVHANLDCPRRSSTVLARVGVVTFGQPPVVTEDLETKTVTQDAASAVLPFFDFSIGALSGEAFRGEVTFRSRIRYFRWKRQWHVVPGKYSSLSDHEVRRRMKIKLRNSGRRPWNAGRKWSPEMRLLIKEKTEAAMRRRDVQERYRRMQSIRTALSHATAAKRRLQKVKTRKAKAPGQASRQKKSPEKETEVKKRQSRDKGRALTVEQRKKISEAVRTKWLDPEYRRRVLQRNKAQRTDAEGTAPVSPERDLCREKYDELMETLLKLVDEINVLEAQRLLVPLDHEVVREIDDALESSRNLIEAVRDAVVDVEKRLGIEAPCLEKPFAQVSSSNGTEPLCEANKRE